LKLREAVEIRDQEKETLTNLIEQLQRLNHSLQEQEEEERRILEEKNNTIILLQSQLEEYFIQPKIKF
jgi:DNA-binding protein H-NS